MRASTRLFAIAPSVDEAQSIAVSQWLSQFPCAPQDAVVAGLESVAEPPAREQRRGVRLANALPVAGLRDQISEVSEMLDASNGALVALLRETRRAPHALASACCATDICANAASLDLLTLCGRGQADAGGRRRCVRAPAVGF